MIDSSAETQFYYTCVVEPFKIDPRKLAKPNCWTVESSHKKNGFINE